MVSRRSVLTLSSPQVVDLLLYKGDTGKFRITVKDDNGTAVNVSTATWDSDIRSTPDSAVTLASFTVTPVGGDTSSVDVSITAILSNGLPLGELYYDVQMTLTGTVTTLFAGLLIVKQDVSR